MLSCATQSMPRPRLFLIFKQHVSSDGGNTKLARELISRVGLRSSTCPVALLCICTQSMSEGHGSQFTTLETDTISTGFLKCSSEIARGGLINIQLMCLLIRHKFQRLHSTLEDDSTYPRHMLIVWLLWISQLVQHLVPSYCPLSHGE
jgi:hypothetical protein